MSTLAITQEVEALVVPWTVSPAKPRTIVEEFISDRECHGMTSALHLEPAELVRHVTESSDGPASDLGSYLADGLNDMPLKDRPRLNELYAKVLLGTATLEDHARFVEIIVKATLVHGATQVDCAMQRANVRYAIERNGGGAMNSPTRLISERDELLKVLAAIVHEFRQTYDADCDDGFWKGAASIDARLMESAERLVNRNAAEIAGKAVSVSPADEPSVSAASIDGGAR